MVDSSRELLKKLHDDQIFYSQYLAGVARRYQEIHGDLIEVVRDQGFEVALKRAEQAVKNAQASIEDLQERMDDIPLLRGDFE
ncbi:hypothetical protein [Saccharopolyspora tripterygii]